jgi:hypothetical protein
VILAFLHFAVMIEGTALALMALVAARDKQPVTSGLPAAPFFLWLVRDQHVTALTSTVTTSAGFFLWCLALPIAGLSADAEQPLVLL